MSEHEEQVPQEDEADVEGHRLVGRADGSEDPKGGEDDTPDVEGHIKKGHARMAKNRMRS